MSGDHATATRSAPTAPTTNAGRTARTNATARAGRDTPSARRTSRSEREPAAWRSMACTIATKPDDRRDQREQPEPVDDHRDRILDRRRREQRRRVSLRVRLRVHRARPGAEVGEATAQPNDRPSAEVRDLRGVTIGPRRREVDELDVAIAHRQPGRCPGDPDDPQRKLRTVGLRPIVLGGRFVAALHRHELHLVADALVHPACNCFRKHDLVPAGRIRAAAVEDQGSFDRAPDRVVSGRDERVQVGIVERGHTRHRKRRPRRDARVGDRGLHLFRTAEHRRVHRQRAHSQPVESGRRPARARQRDKGGAPGERDQEREPDQRSDTPPARPTGSRATTRPSNRLRARARPSIAPDPAADQGVTTPRPRGGHPDIRRSTRTHHTAERYRRHCERRPSQGPCKRSTAVSRRPDADSVPARRLPFPFSVVER